MRSDFSDGVDSVDRLLRRADHLEQLVREIRGEPNRAMSTRTELRFGKKGSLAVTIAGPHRGRITDFEAGGGKGMTPLQFIQSELGLDFRSAVSWAQRWLGIDGYDPPPRGAVARQPQPPANDDPEATLDAQRAAKVAKIVADSMPIEGTEAERYLASRGITGPMPPDAVAYRPNAWRAGGRRGGALVVYATDADGNIQAVQQIYLDGGAKAAGLEVKKRTNGPMTGAAVKLRAVGEEP